MKMINQSEIFAKLRGIEAITAILRSTDSSEYIVDYDDLSLDISHIRKRMTDPMRLDVLASYDKGDLQVLLTNPDGERLTSVPPQFITWRSQHNGKVITNVNIAHYASRSKRSGEVSIPRSKLYTLLQYGYIMSKVYPSPKMFDTNTAFLRNGCEMYSKFNTQVVDRTFGISTTPVLANSLMFAYAKYFLVNLMDQDDSDRVDNIARQACSTAITDVAISNVNSHFNFSEIADWFDFVKIISTFHPRLSKVTPSKIIQDVTSLYGSNMILALDCPQFIILNALGVVHMAQINTEFRLEKVFGKSLLPFYNSIIQALR